MNITRRRRRRRKLSNKCLRVVTTALINDILELVDEYMNIYEEKRIRARDRIIKEELGASENILTELALEDPDRVQTVFENDT